MSGEELDQYLLVDFRGRIQMFAQAPLSDAAIRASFSNAASYMAESYQEPTSGFMWAQLLYMAYASDNPLKVRKFTGSGAIVNILHLESQRLIHKCETVANGVPYVRRPVRPTRGRFEFFFDASGEIFKDASGWDFVLTISVENNGLVCQKVLAQPGLLETTTVRRQLFRTIENMSDQVQSTQE